jgi:hypothetical protein
MLDEEEEEEEDDENEAEEEEEDEDEEGSPTRRNGDPSTRITWRSNRVTSRGRMRATGANNSPMKRPDVASAIAPSVIHLPQQERRRRSLRDRSRSTITQNFAKMTRSDTT